MDSYINSLTGNNAAQPGTSNTSVPPGSPPTNPSNLTPEQLAQLPPLKATLSGEVPGFTIAASDQRPFVNVLAANLPDLLKLGLGVFHAEQSNAAVVFNPKLVPHEELKKADAAGKLDELLPSVDKLLGGEVQAAEPAETNTEQPSSGSPVASAPALTPRTEQKLAASRLANLLEKDPTSGPAPGQGRILNGLLQRAV